MENSIERIGMAQWYVGKAPGIITTIGLGSCVGLTLYDPITKIGGMLHLMLSDSTKFSYSQNINRAKFADTGIRDMYDNMLEMGANKSNLVAKIAGGAQMFAIKEGNDMLNIGARNIEATEQTLGELNIPILGSDVGETYGRTIELDLEDGSLKVITVNRDIKMI